MTKATLAGGVASALLLLAVVVGQCADEREGDPAATVTPATLPSIEPPPGKTHPPTNSNQGFLYGRVTAVDGTVYEGRLRFGGDEEASWGDYFNGKKDENPWAVHAPPDQLEESRPIKILGVEIARRKRRIDLDRPFMARLGDIARIEASGRDLRVTLKSGTVFDLDRFGADDFADGVRVWDAKQGVVDLDEWSIRSIELLPTPSLGAAPDRLHGTVRTQQGDFTGFVQWNREKGVGSDELDGLRFDTILSIERRSPDTCRVEHLDGGEVVLTDLRDVGRGNRGMYVDDPRYGRVLIHWNVLERIDFSPGGSGPAYDDFPPGQPLEGSVTTRAGTRLTGQLVFDLDESETTETLDAPSGGVHYTIPFGLIASIVPSGRDENAGRRATVTLHDGEELKLERTGDLGERNAGMLVFVDSHARPEYVAWTDVEQVDFDRPQAM